jgi:hypothetical protein
MHERNLNLATGYIGAYAISSTPTPRVSVQIGDRSYGMSRAFIMGVSLAKLVGSGQNGKNSQHHRRVVRVGSAQATGFVVRIFGRRGPWAGSARKDTLLPRGTHQRMPIGHCNDPFDVARLESAPTVSSLVGNKPSALAPEDVGEDGGARPAHVLRHGSLCPHNLIFAGPASQLEKHFCSLVDPRSAHRVPAGLEAAKRGNGEVALQADGVLGELLIILRFCSLLRK